MKRAVSKKTRWALLAVGALVLVAGGATAIAHPAGYVKTYTGCLTPQDNLVSLRGGANPARPCRAIDEKVSFSAGDITSVTAGAGLTGGGDNGQLTLALDPKHALPQACGNEQVPKWNAATTLWACANDVDTDTTYTAGAGLDLVVLQEPVEARNFQVAQSHRLPQGCTGGQVPQKAAGGPGWVCGGGSDGPASASHAYFAKQAFVGLQNNTDTVVASLAVPAGSYVISGKATLDSGDLDEQDANCKLSTGDRSRGRTTNFADNLTLPVQDAATFGSDTTVSMTCAVFNGIAWDVALTAIAVGGIN